MTRRSWIANPDPPYNLIPIEEYIPKRERGLTIMPDLPDFVSPIDGSVVKGRKGYREHCRKHNVTGASDFTNEWRENEKRRKNLTRSREQKALRIEALKEAYDKHTRKR